MKKPNASIAIQILPMAENKLNIIDCIIKHIKKQGLNMFVSPFETTVEGELNQLIDILKQCFEISVKNNCTEVMAFVKIAYNKQNGVLTIDEKVNKYN